MAQDEPVSLYKQVDQAGLSLHSSFTFQCHAGLTCFNQCCRTPTILLSPYDIMRLKLCLGIPSGEFLRGYTRQETEQISNLPLVFIDAYRATGSGCPFLGPSGCRVYPHRPAACRLFPVTMGSQLTEQGRVDYYFCRRLDYCQGFATDVEWTVESWKANQGFEEYEKGRKEWLEILLKQGLAGRMAIGARVQELFATISYDLDKFRRLIFSSAFQDAFDLDSQKIENLNKNDLALLQFGYHVFRAVLWGEGDEILADLDK